MTLKERIKKDLTELCSGNGEIADAKVLSAVMSKDRIMREDDSFRFSTKGRPAHFFGKLDAQTVLVMLNPCGDWKKCDHDGVANKRRQLQQSRKKDMDSYINRLISFGEGNYPNTGPFDLKQAAFLKHWKRSGVKLPRGFPETNSESIKAKAVKSVLLDKLQLELIPYCSSRFDTAFFRDGGDVSRLIPVFPFLETVLHEIGTRKRKYVVFCSGVFEPLFKAFSTLRSNRKYPRLELSEAFPRPEERATTGRCRIVWIHYKDHVQKTLIAHTFPWRRFINNERVIAKYGKFCFDVFSRTKRPRSKSKAVVL